MLGCALAGKVYKLKFLAMGGEYREVDCPDNMYILDAAEKGGIDLPGTPGDSRQSHTHAQCQANLSSSALR